MMYLSTSACTQTRRWFLSVHTHTCLFAAVAGLIRIFIVVIIIIGVSTIIIIRTLTPIVQEEVEEEH